MKKLVLPVQKTAKSIRFLTYSFTSFIALAFVFICMTCIKSDAAKPTAAYVDSLPNGNEGVLMYDKNGPQKPASKGWKISGYKALFVLRKYVALLGFLGNGQPFDQFVEAGRDDKFDAYFSYPCGIKPGTFEIAWILRDPASGHRTDQACKIGKPKKTHSQNPRNTYVAQNITQRLDVPIIQETAQRPSILDLFCTFFPSFPLCPTPDPSDTPITVYPARYENTLIQTQAPGDGTLRVDVLLGSVDIESARNPQTITVEAGNRYIEPSEGQGTQEDITSEIPQIISSPSLQIFLDPANWSSENAAAITDLRISLGQRSRLRHPN
jgi:hypothetical protein